MGRQRADRRAQYFVLLAGALALVLILGLNARGHSPDVLGAIFLSGFSLLCGLVLLRTGRSDPDKTLQFRLGVAVTIIGVGYLASAACQRLFGLAAPNPGNLLQLLAVPWLLAGLWTLLRVTYMPAARVLFATEILTLTAFLGLIWWRLLRALSTGWLPGPGRIWFDLIVFCMFAMVFIVLVRTLNVAVILASVGAFGIACTDPIRTVLFVADLPAVIGLIISTYSWALCTAGLLRVNTETPDLGEREAARSEARRNVLVLGTACGLLGGAVALLLVEPLLDATTAMLFLVGMAGFWLREMVQAGQVNRTLEAMRQLAHRDPLTGLGNRRALEDQLRLARRSITTLSLLKIDLDGFKSVNDQLGHKAGDHLLGQVAQLVDRQARGIGATAFRIGGDEFVVIVQDRPTQLEDVARRIVAEVELAGVSAGSHALVAVGASAGLTHRELAGYTSLAELLALLGAADAAMREAKLSGGHTLVVYDERLAKAARRQLELEKRLAMAVTDDAITVHFQPLVSVATGQISGAEALACWNDSLLGSVAPGEFVPVAEQTGLIRELGRQVMRRSLEGAVESGLVRCGLSVSINVSTIQLRVPGFADDVVSLLSELQVPARLLIIEVTESVFVRTGDPAIRALFTLAAHGIGIALDDFGTGYCSIGYLTRLPVSVLKLDRSLTMRLDEPAVGAIARSVIEMAAALELKVVIEGVETVEQEADARALGADLVQGWFYCRDVDSDTLAALLASSRAGLA